MSSFEHEVLGIYRNIQKKIKTFSLIPGSVSTVNKYSKH